jgi:hydroxymethylglutaryl-CoA reductase
MKNVNKNFHKKPLQERLNQLTQIHPELDVKMLQKGGLSTEIADYMIENCIGVLPLPLGLGLGFKINGKSY